jgi:cytochrome P450
MAALDGDDGEPDSPVFLSTSADSALRSMADGHLDVITDLAAVVTSGTAVETIGNTVLALLEFPDEADLLRRDPSMLLLAIDEVLRHDPPVRSVWRVATEDIELPSGVLPAGAFVELSIAAANRDPEVFTAPHRCIFGRLPNPHLTVVAPSVVHTTASVVHALMQRFAVIELDGSTSRAVDHGRHRWRHLPVRVRRR